MLTTHTPVSVHSSVSFSDANNEEDDDEKLDDLDDDELDDVS
jgi:hypothetical protein